MKLKTYRAASMADALAAVKKDLGRNAVILHTRQVKTGGFLGLRRRSVVEITASDSPPKGAQNSGKQVDKAVGLGKFDSGKVDSGKFDSSKLESSKASSNIEIKAAQPDVRPLLAAIAAGAYKSNSATKPPAPTPASQPSRAASSSAASSTPPVFAAQPKAPENPHIEMAFAGLAASVQGKASSVGKPAATSTASTASKPLSAAPPAMASAADRLEPEPQVMTVRQRVANDSAVVQAAPGTRSQPDQDRSVSASTPARDQAPPGSKDKDRLLSELADIKLLVNQVLQSGASSGVPGGGAAAGAMPDALFRHYLRLLEASVSRDIADSIVGAVRDELTPEEMRDESIVRGAVLRRLAALIPVAEHAVRPQTVGDGRPLTIALVGPTGVGKTTTIAKLAAAYKLRQGRSVAMITSDTYRIAAVDQLRTYASILGVPLKVVMTPMEMDAAVRSLVNFDVVLIDSAGRSQNAKERLRELASFLDAAKPHETHLVLSSASSEGVLYNAAESFAQAGIVPNRLILSKMDEAVNFGVVVNVARRMSAKLSFITTGQEVPDHIEAGRPDRLARMILDNALAPTPSAAGTVATHTYSRAPAAELQPEESVISAGEELLAHAGGNA